MSKQCPLAVHHKCQRSWERFAKIAKEDQCEAFFCHDHHLSYQKWFTKNRKTMEEHKRDAKIIETQKNAGLMQISFPSWRSLGPMIRELKENWF